MPAAKKAAPKAKQEEAILYDFYGTECEHCKDMDPLVERLEKEERVKLTRLEVWHNAENQKILEELDNGKDNPKCGAIPFFFNTKTKKAICGTTNYETFKKWALGK